MSLVIIFNVAHVCNKMKIHFLFIWEADAIELLEIKKELIRKPKGSWHSCQRGSHPSELNYSQMVQ